MDSGIAALILDIVAILSIAAAGVLCVALTTGLVKVFPSLRRSALNFEKVTESAAEAAPHVAKTAENLKETIEYLRNTAGDIAQASPVLRLLGSAGAAANLANTGIGRIFGVIRRLFPK